MMGHYTSFTKLPKRICGSAKHAFITSCRYSLEYVDAKHMVECNFHLKDRRFKRQPRQRDGERKCEGRPRNRACGKEFAQGV